VGPRNPVFLPVVWKLETQLVRLISRGRPLMNAPPHRMELAKAQRSASAESDRIEGGKQCKREDVDADQPQEAHDS